jgi:hypothetical protein
MDAICWSDICQPDQKTKAVCPADRNSCHHCSLLTRCCKTDVCVQQFGFASAILTVVQCDWKDLGVYKHLAIILSYF